MANQRRYSGILWLLLWGAIVMLATLVADCLYVMWPYPHGALGVEAFQVQVRTEWAFLVNLCGERLPPLAATIYNGLHTVLFQWPGFDYMIARASDPSAMDSGGEMMRKAVLNTQPFWGSALAGLQLFSIRVAVVGLSAPLCVGACIAGLADGLLSWYLRRTGGGRESGFVYHRAKRHAGHAILIVGFVYLALPIQLNPAVVLTSCIGLCATAVRIAAARFKKYV
jgi:integrating conjugative element membrane protein (TIGR03747 family)